MEQEEKEYEQEPDELLSELPPLEPEQMEALQKQGTRLVPPARASLAHKDSARHWDIFYKRNGDRFFKNRHWIVREFPELLTIEGPLLEAGCGAGALLFPLAEVAPQLGPFLACDLSPRAVGLVRSHPLYHEPRFRAFQADLTTEGAPGVLRKELEAGSGLAAVVTAVFLLSALHGDGLQQCAVALASALRPGGLLVLRDYARHDMAQLRFGPGHKIRDNLYLRQDGTTSYFFTKEEIREILTGVGLHEERIGYVQRRTTNHKEGLDVPRTFLQACYSKPPA